MTKRTRQNLSDFYEPQIQKSSLSRNRLRLSDRFRRRLIDWCGLNRSDIDLAIRQRCDFASFFAKQRLADRGLIRNNISIRVTVPSAEDRRRGFFLRLRTGDHAFEVREDFHD